MVVIHNFHQGGAEDVRKHKWFRSIDWLQLLERKISAPIQPKHNGPGDAINFEIYPEIDIQQELQSSDTQDSFSDLFRGF